MPKSLRPALLLGFGLLSLGGLGAQAQIRPYSADDPSFNAPQMRRHGSGLHRPNKPGHHGHVPLHGHHRAFGGERY